MKNQFLSWLHEFENSDDEIKQWMIDTVEDSPYHREENVWVHTSMVVNYFLELSPVVWEKDSLMGALACVFHDFGKPKVEEEIYKDGRLARRYNGHEEASGAYWMDYWSANKHDIQSLIPDINDAYNIMVMISYHLPYRLKGDKLQALATHLYHFKLMGAFSLVLKSDVRGRISDDEVESIKNSDKWIDEVLFATQTLPLNDTSDVLMLIGSPGSGKSWYTQEHFKDSTILSFDDIRGRCFPDEEIYHELYLKFTGYDFTSAGELHDALNVPKEITTQRGFLNYVLTDDFKKANGNHAVLDNTSVTRKSRRTSRNILRNIKKDAQFSAGFFFGSLDDIKSNNQKRAPLKNVPDTVIDNMYFRTCPPILGEFNSITIIPVFKA